MAGVLVRSLAAAAVAAAVASGGFYATVRFFPGAFGNYFAIKHVQLTGEVEGIDPKAVRRALSGGIEGNLFTVDVQAVAARFAEVPWVRSVALRRRWPDALEVAVRRHRPFAHFEDGRLVDEDGTLFSVPEDDALAASGLPEIFGPEDRAAQAVARHRLLTARMREVGFEGRISEIAVTERGSWTVVVDRGGPGPLQVLLGAAGEDKALADRFTQVLLQYPEVCRVLGGAPARIDARYRQAFAASLKAGAQ